MTACRKEPCLPHNGAVSSHTGLQRLVTQLEGAVTALGRAVLDEYPAWYEDRFAEFYDGGLRAFGPGGPDAAARLDAELCFLIDCPFEVGAFEYGLHGRSRELLERSELRAWRIESIEGAGVLGALCPLGSGRARLETVRRPHGELTRGAIVVARSVPLGPGRWALLGRAPIVDREAVADFDGLLAQLDSPRGEFWRVHGAVLARSAWAWPEDREHTGEGEIVRPSLATFALCDPEAVVATLDCDPELAGLDEPGTARDMHRWGWRWEPPRPRSVNAERGVRYELCEEDAATPPVLAQIVVDLAARDLCLLTPTPDRLALAERLLAGRLGAALGPVTLRAVDPPSVVPRWKRAAFERPIVPLARGARARKTHRAA